MISEDISLPSVQPSYVSKLIRHSFVNVSLTKEREAIREKFEAQVQEDIQEVNQRKVVLHNSGKLV